MKQVFHKIRSALKERAKIITILENSEDQECVTRIQKNFIYVLSVPVNDSEELPDPDIRIKKSFDTKTRDERFCFRIRGAFYVTKNRRIMRIDFCLTLKIHLKWKTKVFSPKKSVTVA